MARVVAQFFSGVDTPLIGASPTCTAYRLDTLASVSGAMTEIGNGLYHYSFTEATGVEYATLCDAGAGVAMAGGRYTHGVISLGRIDDFLLAMASGAFTETVVSGTIKDFAFSDYDGNPLYTLRIEDATGRTRTVG